MNDTTKWIAGGVGLLALIGVGAAVIGGGDEPDEPATSDEPAAEEGRKGRKAKARRGRKRGGEGRKPDVSAVGKPNVLIVLWDTVRADRLTIYNEDLPTTPKMAEWAESGVVFETAISPAMWTVPSHASMFTGLPPTTHGAGYDHRWLDRHHTTMAEWLNQHGYDTYAFSANPNLSPDRVNMLQGVDHIDTSWSRRWKRKVTANARTKQIKADKSTEISPSFEDKALTNKPFTYNAAPVTHEAFVGWLDRRQSDAPWFAYLSYMEAHKPRIPRLESRRKVSDDDLIEVQLETDISFKNQLVYSYGRMEYTDRELEAINRVYDACLVDLDNETSAMLEDLEAKGYLDNTIVIFTSDHGELLGEHHLFGHRNSVYQSLVHVPLVISWPGHLDPKRVQEEVSNLDLFNTVLDLTELPKPDHGFSTGNLITSPNNAGGVFTEMESIDRLGWSKVSKIFSDLERGPWMRKYRALVHEGWKVIRDTEGDLELYDLHHDPHEETNLAGKEGEKLAKLLSLLDAYEASMAPYDPSKREAGEGEAEDDDAMKEQLALLGYLDEEELDDEGDSDAE